MQSNIPTMSDKESAKLNGHDKGDYKHFQEVEVPVPWGKISGKWWGPRNIKPILAIHGWQDNAGSFDTLAPLLVHQNRSMYCIDLPGHGFSSHYPTGQYYYLFWDGVHIVRRIVKHFKWESVSLIGHSLGGGIGFLYASTFPKEVEKYISIDLASPCVRLAKTIMPYLGDSVDKFLKCETYVDSKAHHFAHEEALDVLYDAHHGSLTKESCKIMLVRGAKPTADNKYVFVRDPRLKVAGLGFMMIDQALEFAGRIQCDVLNLKAYPGLSTACPEYYDLVLDKIKETASRFEKHEIKGTHHLHLNDPRSIRDVIVNFLE